LYFTASYLVGGLFGEAGVDTIASLRRFASSVSPDKSVINSLSENGHLSDVVSIVVSDSCSGHKVRNSSSEGQRSRSEKLSGSAFFTFTSPVSGI
jgi:hypothetical protein